MQHPLRLADLSGRVALPDDALGELSAGLVRPRLLERVVVTADPAFTAVMLILY